MLTLSNKFYFLEKIHYIIIFLYSILFFFFIYDYGIINFLSTDWLYNSGELASYQLSFEFYKKSEWTWPITSNPNYGVGINNNIILSDNITILNIIFKILAPILPEKFQFYGLWIFTCFFLQCLFSYKIVHYYTKDSIFSTLASFFFLSVPVLLDRSFIHLSLMSHWIILCSFYLIISSKDNKIGIKNTLLITFSLLVNLYISIMIITFFLFFLLFSGKLKTLFKIKQFFFINFYILLVLLIIGFFNIRLDNYSTYGFGYYKSNLLTFLDSTGGFSNNNWSLINVFDLPNKNGEEEGFAYLGAGGILLLTFAAYYWINNKNIKIKNYYKILLLSLVFTLAAISNNVHIGDYNIININLNKFIMAFTSLFRSSGRFIWPIHYLIIISSIVFLFKFFKPKIAYCLIILILLIQLIDISKASLNLNNKVIKTSSNNNFFESKFWFEISKDHENILSSFPDGSVENLHKYAYIISNYKFKKTNIIYQARADQKKIAKARYDLYTDLLSKSLNEKSLYLIDLNHAKHINLLYNNDNKFDFFKEKDQWFLIKKKKIIPIANEKDADELFVNELSRNQNISFKELQKYLGLGWYKSHNGYWSDGFNSSILFRSKNKLSRFEIVCEIFNDNFELKNFEFYLNKSKINNITIKKLNNNHLIILDIVNYSLDDENIFTIKNNNKISRSDLFLAPDGRILGLKIISVNVL